MAKEQNKYTFDNSFYDASATYTAGTSSPLTVLSTLFLHDGYYRFVADISDLDYTGSEAYVMNVYTNSGGTLLGSRPILAADLFNPSTGNYRGVSSLCIWINTANLTTNVTVELVRTNNSGTASITCELAIVDGN